MAIIIRVNGNILCAQIIGSHLTPEEICNLINCSSLEVIDMEYGFMIVDAEPQFNKKKFNFIATKFLQATYGKSGYIAGDALLCSKNLFKQE
jgi:hypothetical protein